MSNTPLISSRSIYFYCVLLLLLVITNAIHAQPEIAGLTLDELEMLEDFELKQLRDFSKGHGSVSKAGDNEELDLFSLVSPKPTQPSDEVVAVQPKNNGSSFFFGGPMPILPSMVKVPTSQVMPTVIAQASNSKKPKLKLRRKGMVSPAESPKKDAKKAQDHTANSSPNGLREDDSNPEQSNQTNDLTGEDYEKLAKLLQTFVNRRKFKTDEPKSATDPPLMSTKTSSVSLPPWAVTQKTTTASLLGRSANQKGLSKITEQDEEEETSFAVNEPVQSPEPAKVWHERKGSTKTTHRFDKPKSNEQEADLESKLALIDNEVQGDPREWELKMRQLSRELSTILHRLKNEKEQKSLVPKTEFKVAVQNLNPNLIHHPKTTTKSTPDARSIFEVVDGDAGNNEVNEEEQREETPKPDSTQRLTLGSLKINRKALPTQNRGPTNGKAFVTILREGIARQTDINEYVFIASITLIRDSNKIILVDTGLATDINGRTDLLTKLSKLDIAPPNVDYVITSHGHPDHAGNTNDFPDAIHFQGNMLHYRSKFNFSDLFEKDLHQLTQNVQLLKTPGHTPDDITVMVRNTDRYGSVAVCGDVFVAEEDQEFPLMWKPMAWSERTQETSRKRLICDADYIVPGHGKVFKVTDKMRTNFKC